MTKEEKLMRLLEMQEHPERFTEEEIYQLMADGECRQFYEQMVRATDALFSEKCSVQSENFADDRHSLVGAPKRNTSLLKIAAMFVGVLVLSGVAFAAIHLVRNVSQTNQKQQQTEIVVTDSLRSVADSSPAECDSTLMKPEVFEDAELATMLGKMAEFYDYEVIYRSEAAKHVRLFFTWDKNAQIEDVVATFNKFDRIHITLQQKQIIVE